MNNKLLRLIESIEQNYGLRVYISITNKNVRLFKVIFGIETQVGYIKIESKNNYKYINIEIVKEYRGKGLGTLLFNLYKRICNDNDVFDFPDFIYSDNISIISFLLKKGFFLEGFIENNRLLMLTSLEKNNILEYIEVEKNKLKAINRLKEPLEYNKKDKIYKLNYIDKKFV